MGTMKSFSPSVKSVSIRSAQCQFAHEMDRRSNARRPQRRIEEPTRGQFASRSKHASTIALEQPGRGTAGWQSRDVVTVDTTVWVDYLRGVENPETDWFT
jgi:hypothetical protein